MADQPLQRPAAMTAQQAAQALARYDAILAQQPDDHSAHHGRGNALKDLRRFDEAVAAFDRALALRPDLRPAFYDRGAMLAAAHRDAEWFEAFLGAAYAAYRPSAWAPQFAPPPSLQKTQHDQEQQAYQKQVGILAVGNALHIEGGARLAGAAINPANAAAATQQWRARKPQIVVVDDLLTPQALKALREFCWGSTVWRTGYDSGYLGAFPEHGFAVPLLAQIVEEFRSIFSGICGDHPLKYIWAFKYDSERQGIGIHADEAAVNVNFWITPDEANCDSDSGGLVVWDVAAPLDWDFAGFNGDIARIRDFLQANGATSTTIPYRANRAVIFDSDLFHQTDAIRFRQGYCNRRINITLLYGDRDKG